VLTQIIEILPQDYKMALESFEKETDQVALLVWYMARERRLFALF